MSLAVGHPVLLAQALPEHPLRATETLPRTLSITPLRREALRLIRADNAARLVAEAARSDTSPPSIVTETTGEVVSLAPFVVREDKLPDFSTSQETPTQKFFRTGTLAQHEGRKVTTQLWLRGDSGVMLSFRW